MSKPVKLENVVFGQIHLDPETILAAAKGQGFTGVVVIGELETGEIWVSASDGVGDSVILMEKAKRQIVFGDV